MMDWVYEFNFLNWLFLFLIVLYTFLWFTGASFLNDPERRFPRIESLDDYFLSDYGTIFLQIRNFLIWLFLLFSFLIIR